MLDPRETSRDRDGQARDRAYEGRKRSDDPRDALLQDLDLPLGREREVVLDRDRVYELNGEESRTLATVGAFRVVPERDLAEPRDESPDWDDTLAHLHEQCRAVNVSKGALEGAFADELALLQPTAGYMRLVTDRILYVWEQRRAEARDRTEEQTKRVKAIQQKLDRLDEAFLFAQSIDSQSYERQRDRLREEMTLAQIDHHADATDELDVQGILAFAERILPRASDLWVQASLDYKQRLQALFFPEGIAYDGNRFNRTAVTAPLFNYLAPSAGADERVVSPVGVEPTDEETSEEPLHDVADRDFPNDWSCRVPPRAMRARPRSRSARPRGTAPASPAGLTRLRRSAPLLRVRPYRRCSAWPPASRRASAGGTHRADPPQMRPRSVCDAAGPRESWCLE